jgi:hypothetical protein
MAQSLPLSAPAERGTKQGEPHGMPNRIDEPTGCSLLSDDDYQRLRPHLSQVVLITRKASMKRRPIEHVYFPIDGVASLVITTSDGHSAESAPSA